MKDVLKAIGKLLGLAFICLSILCSFYIGRYEDELVKNNSGATGKEYSEKVNLHQGFVVVTSAQSRWHLLIILGIYGGILIGGGLLFGPADRREEW